MSSLYATTSEPMTTTQPLVGAGFGIRALARIIDTVLHNGIALATSFMVGIVLGIFYLAQGGMSPAINAKLTNSSLIDFVFPLLGYIAYHAIAEGIGGASIGKAITGLVVNNEGSESPISFGQAVGRSFAFFIDSLFLGLVGYSSMKNSPLQQRYGDKWAGTMVTKRNTLTSSTIPSMSKVAVGILAGVVIDMLFAISLIIVKLVM